MNIPLNPRLADMDDPPLGMVTVSSTGTAVVLPFDIISAAAAGTMTTQDWQGIAAALERQREALEEELTADMVSFRKRDTGLDNTVFISVAFPRHTPRIKVAVNPATHVDPTGSNASVSIEDGSVLAGTLPPDVQRRVSEFVKKNRRVLLDYWEKRIDTGELRDLLKKV